MCIAKTTTTVAQRSLCNKLPVKQLVVPLRSKCTTFIEEPIYRPRFRKQDWEQSSLWGKLSGRFKFSFYSFRIFESTSQDYPHLEFICEEMV
ncbi:hypothetical protein WUBG_15336 [Wuchereria bancrofti]|uniref:Uncharacterized protein n=1 Tax=Wuchereria bancrofti TaxID=6293 RepID=J9DVK1_WUCBA|nr:hypothetical protein WUBG_15336 [Wuchereria bancrofti]